MNEFIQYKFFWVKLVSSCIMFLWFIHFLVCFSRSFGEGNGTPLRYSWLENPRGRGAWWAAVHGVQRVGHDWATSLSLLTFMHWRRQWQTTPVFLPGESQGQGSLVGCCLWGRTESNMTEVTQQQQQQVIVVVTELYSIACHNLYFYLCTNMF